MAVELRDVSVVRRDRRGGDPKLVLDRVSLRVGYGERWVVLGPNGAGKSTLLAVAGAVLHPTSGTVDVLGARIGRTDVRALRERVGLVDARTARAIPPERRGGDVVLSGAFGSIAMQAARIEPEHRRRAEELRAAFQADGLADRRFGDCSEGERRRLLLARALMDRPELLLLDEPTSSLDLPSRERLLAALAATAAADGRLPMLVVTHHLEEIPAPTTHALLLREGRVLAAGPVEEALTAETVSACFGIEVDVRAVNGRWTATF